MTTVRTIMNARAKQRKTSIMVQGFKCQEIGHKRYIKLKNRLEELQKRQDDQEFFGGELTSSVERLKEEIKEYEKKNNINEKPKKLKIIKKDGLMSKVRSLFSGRKRG